MTGSFATRSEIFVLLLFFGIAAFVVALYFETFASMAAIWRYSDYAHGIMVPPICAYLLWRLRAPLAALELKPNAWGLGPLAALVGVWLVGRAAGVQVVEQLAAVLLIPAAIVALLGWQVAKRAMFPLLFLLAAVPIGESFVPALMRITADISTTLLRLVGVPVFREGQVLSLPGGVFEVADVCSGLAFATCGTLIALLFSHFTFRSQWRRFVFVVSTAALMVLTNGVRAFIVMFVASATHMQLLAGRDHVVFGWILFGIVVVALMNIGARFTDIDDVAPLPVGGGSVALGGGSHKSRLLTLMLAPGLMMLAATMQPLQAELGNSALWMWPAVAVILWVLYRAVGSQTEEKSDSASFGGGRYRSTGGIVVLAVAPLVLSAGPALLPDLGSSSEPTASVIEWPTVGECWHAGEWSEPWSPRFDSPDATLSGAYDCVGNMVNVYVAAYQGAKQGRELASSNNHVLPVAMQQRAPSRAESFSGVDGATIRVNEVEIDSGRSASLVWYWYRTGYRHTASLLSVKIWRMLGLVRRGPVEDAVYILVTPLDSSSRERLADVARGLVAHQTLVDIEQ